MRYKIKTNNDSAYHEVLSMLEGEATVFLTSPKRRLVSTGDLSSGLRRAVEKRGAKVVVDRQYQLESAPTR